MKTWTKRWGVDINQDTPRMDMDTFEVVPFTEDDAAFIEKALIELQKVLLIRNWHLDDIHIK